MILQACRAHFANPVATPEHQLGETGRSLCPAPTPLSQQLGGNQHYAMGSGSCCTSTAQSSSEISLSPAHLNVPSPPYFWCIFRPPVLSPLSPCNAIQQHPRRTEGGERDAGGHEVLPMDGTCPPGARRTAQHLSNRINSSFPFCHPSNEPRGCSACSVSMANSERRGKQTWQQSDKREIKLGGERRQLKGRQRWAGGLLPLPGMSQQSKAVRTQR